MKVLPRTRSTVAAATAAALLGGAALVSFGLVTAADHTDGPLAAGDQAADIADVYSFVRGENLVLALTISNVQAAPEIELGRSIFDPEVLYQIKIDTDGDATEDLVIQSFVTGNPTNQVMHVRGPVAPEVFGTEARIVQGPVASVRVSTDGTAITQERQGLRVFAGLRDDPFFFDLTRLLAILGGQASGFADPGTDTFAGLNVYALVIELPLAALGDPSQLSIWGTTHRL